ncbi:MAG TPA: hypothetical protein PKG48_11865 [Bacteroidales bacterium]|nr:hypothetical protein [Bacteroidales bacterium]HPS61766.1 hypothetical protein [Bacteroidales bacterium]
MKNYRFTILLTVCLAAVSHPLLAQDYRPMDSLTYRLYLEKKWDSLATMGQEALDRGFDYYYLRARMGIAFFEKRQYIRAIAHLEKARRFNSGDPLLTEYLYYALLWSNRKEDALALRSSLTEETRKRTTADAGFLQEAGVEGGYTFSSDRRAKNLGKLAGNDGYYGEQDLYGNNLYAGAGLKLRVARHVGLNLSYSHLQFYKTKYFRYGRYEDVFEGTTDTTWGKIYHYSFPFTSSNLKVPYTVRQHDIFAGMSFYLPGQFTLTPVFHVIRVAHSLTVARMTSHTVMDTSYYTSQNDSTYFFPFNRVAYEFPRTDTSFYNYLAGVNLNKNLGLFSVGVSGTWSNLNGVDRVQAGVSATWFPLGNLDLYGTITLSGLFGKDDHRFLPGLSGGAKVAPWLWVEGNFFYGDYTNASLYQGSVVYNSTDKQKYQAGATLIFVTKKHLGFSLYYRYFSKESRQFFYDGASGRMTSADKPYQTHTLIGGITWKL